VGDVDGPLRALDGVAALLGAVGGVAAVDGVAVFPQAWRDELAEEALIVEHLLDLATGVGSRRGRQVGRADVVVVTLHAIETELLVLADLGRESDLVANGRAERVGAGADIPGTEGEAVG